MSKEYDIEIANTGKPVFATITVPDRLRSPFGLVLVTHGFKGFRNWGFFPATAQALAANGLICIRIDLSMNGMGGGSTLVVHPDDFANETISSDVSDLHAAIRAIGAREGSLGPLLNEWNGVYALLGHSRGAAVSMIVGREIVEQETTAPTPLRVIGWNAVGTLQRWTPRQRAQWETAGHISVTNTRTGQVLAMNVGYAKDIERNEDRFNISKAIRVLGSRLHLIHAEQDVTVPLGELERAIAHANVAVDVTPIARTGHTFGIEHPMLASTEAFDAVLQHTLYSLSSLR
ncbi:MAG: alpha/beta fold hydrolase [Candidatus Kapabacteria bacterium]|jgi:pimeloyl-ACP methyl ester carboxylesterase|nr:alpha/beta fold hydrolase [Candidatus Kapabacteria bacterium]